MKNKKDILKILDGKISEKESDWHKEAEYRAINKKWLRRSQFVALKILQTIRKQGITQKDLAEKMGLKPQQINKWVKGKCNFTFETITKIENALGVELMNIPPRVETEKVISASLETNKVIGTSLETELLIFIDASVSPYQTQMVQEDSISSSQTIPISNITTWSNNQNYIH